MLQQYSNLGRKENIFHKVVKGQIIKKKYYISDSVIKTQDLLRQNVSIIRDSLVIAGFRQRVRATIQTSTPDLLIHSITLRLHIGPTFICDKTMATSSLFKMASVSSHSNSQFLIYVVGDILCFRFIELLAKTCFG